MTRPSTFRGWMRQWLTPATEQGVIEPNFPARTRFKVERPLQAECLVDADNPVEPNRVCDLPPGTLLETDVDSVPHAPAFLCFPVDYGDWEPKLVRHADRFSGGYQGYRLLVSKHAVGKTLSVA